MLVVAEEVREALEAGAPVVALETTLVAHGFPAGEGLDVGRASAEAVRAGGAVPAAVGVLDGALRVGLTDDELARFDASAVKAGPNRLAECVAEGLVGATTVGSTLVACRGAGISVLATGGIGGVHRGWTTRPDVSADLGALVRVCALVVCSGVKSLLDVAATLELLESLGVPVAGWRTDTLPLFYSADGGPPLATRADTPEEVVRLARAHWGLLGTALVLAQPPPESFDAEPLIAEALEAAERQRVTGSAVTPFVLARLHERSGGRTLAVNKKLILANARLAAELAVSLAA